MFNENEEQLINMGNSAEELLKTDVFTQTVNTMVDATFQAFCNSNLRRQQPGTKPTTIIERWSISSVRYSNV